MSPCVKRARSCIMMMCMSPVVKPGHGASSPSKTGSAASLKWEYPVMIPALRQTALRPVNTSRIKGCCRASKTLMLTSVYTHINGIMIRGDPHGPAPDY